MSIIISPSILSADFANLKLEIQKIENGGADWIHIDVMDGHLVPNITIGVPVVKSIKKITNLPLDVHLMIENPEKYIEPFAKAGADIITFHYESLCHSELDLESSIFGVINKIHSFGIKSGISIKPKTEAQVLLPYLDKVDMVLIMTVEPGFGGQEFITDCAEKIKVIKNTAPQSLIIQVDGGINEKTGKLCKDFGANSLVAGSYIYNSNNIKKAIESLR